MGKRAESEDKVVSSKKRGKDTADDGKKQKKAKSEKVRTVEESDPETEDIDKKEKKKAKEKSKKKKKEKKKREESDDDSEADERPKKIVKNDRVKAKKDKKEKKSKETTRKAKEESSGDDDDEDDDADDDLEEEGGPSQQAGVASEEDDDELQEEGGPSAPEGPPTFGKQPDPEQADNPKVFVGNLSTELTERALYKLFEECGPVADTYWMTDKKTRQWKGSGFVTYEDGASAAKAVQMDGREVLGQAIKVDHAKPMASWAGVMWTGKDSWRRHHERKGYVPAEVAKQRGIEPGFQDGRAVPPPKNADTWGKVGAGGDGAGSIVFVGNVAYEATDEDVHAFVGGQEHIKAIRWLTHKDTGAFKGCGYIEFWDEAAAGEFVKKNGEELKGRPLRIDHGEKKDKTTAQTNYAMKTKFEQEHWDTWEKDDKNFDYEQATETQEWW